MMFLHVTHAKYIEDCKVEISFNNGKTGIADLADALRCPIFEPLKDKTQSVGCAELAKRIMNGDAIK